ncbi:MAG: serine dehydratase [Treponema sp. GWA1_62_8]|nr:MAG: serine dehydratase [Treponema sp. GWA1_62_8]
MKFRFLSFDELAEIVESEPIDAESFALKREAFISGKTEAGIEAELDRRIAVTRKALIRGLGEPQRSRSGLTDGAAVKLAAFPSPLVRDGLFARALRYSLAINEVNACGGKVVSFPTAGSSGIVPGSIWAWWDSRASRASRTPSADPDASGVPAALDPPYDPLLRGAFLNASLAGILIAQGATLAGSEGGCQAECGAAGAMAAAALGYLQGLPLRGRFDAAALSLKNSLGLVCDPVAGLVEVPCVKRNAFVAANALVAVELAMAGIRSAVPFDEVVSAMKSIGDSLPSSLRESAEGGLAMTPTGLACKRRLEES